MNVSIFKIGLEKAQSQQRLVNKKGVVLLLALFLITLVILFTDKNLQTDFGSVKPYYVHWYGLLATSLVDLIGAILLFAKPTRSLLRLAGGWCVLMTLFLILDVFTYKQVGFSTIGEFARYLFVPVFYDSSLFYIPGLYDLLLVLYIISAVYLLKK